MASTNRIYIGGTFDTLHSGHINLLRRAKYYGTVIVSVNTDEFATAYKRKPICPLKERISVLRELRCVDEVIVNEGGADSKPAILAARATHICHGDDWTGESLMKQMDLTLEWLDRHNIDFLYLPYTEGISSTQLRNAIEN